MVRLVAFSLSPTFRWFNSGYVVGRRSSDVVQRLGPRRLKTQSGHIYTLIGSMRTKDSDSFPASLVPLFQQGFPENWEQLVQGKFFLPDIDQSATVTCHFLPLHDWLMRVCKCCSDYLNAQGSSESESSEGVDEDDEPILPARAPTASLSRVPGIVCRSLAVFL